MSDRRGFDFLKSDALIIAFSTLVFYSAAYIFWFGFMSFFWIPFGFVDVGLREIIVGAGLFVAYMLLLVMSLFLLYEGLFLIRKPLATGLVAWVKQLREKRERRISESKVPITSRFLDLLMPILVVFMFSVLFSYFLGQLVAWRTRDFLVIAASSTSPEMVVLYKSGDNLICAPFDRKKKKVYKQFTILRLDKESVPMLSFQKVGPLSVEE